MIAEPELQIARVARCGEFGEGNVFDFNLISAGEHHGTLDDVFQFADVPRPAIAHHLIERFRTEAADACGLFRR